MRQIFRDGQEVTKIFDKLIMKAEDVEEYKASCIKELKTSLNISESEATSQVTGMVR